MSDLTDQEPEDTGEPIVELAGLDEETSPGLYERVCRSIERRSLTSNFLSMVWHVPGLILMEILKLLFEREAPSDGKTP